MVDEGIGDRGGEAALRQVVLQDDDVAGLLDGSEHEVGVERLDRVHVDHPDADPVDLELVGGLERLPQDLAVGEDRRVGAVAGDEARCRSGVSIVAGS